MTGKYTKNDNFTIDGRRIDYVEGSLKLPSKEYQLKSFVSAGGSKPRADVVKTTDNVNTMITFTVNGTATDVLSFLQGKFETEQQVTVVFNEYSYIGFVAPFDRTNVQTETPIEIFTVF